MFYVFMSCESYEPVRVKGFKNQSGLQWHETLKHSFYNTLSLHIQPVSDFKLLHLKKAIVKELQKCFKNYHNAVRKQVFSIHCSEDAFVGIFKDHITHYSRCGSSYLCQFEGEKAFDEIGKILNDKSWGERNYGKGQLSFVCLQIPEGENNNYDQKIKKSKSNLLADGEMIVQ
ncbi:hypothetical protein GLOIN_2v1488230 [Rhizophagus clarus]|uniref:Uncharacterized protein n=1 Tax=Rhizophagus clarus TaxID=94130 RepID=A0A8H3MJ70_9GLOM|nr:hypothetical protein GLOIN_2v1488230 [Rhizophagus clarus]